MDTNQGPWSDLRTVGRDLANFLSWIWGGLAVVNHKPPAQAVVKSTNGCSNIVPTPEELAAIDLPEDQHAPTSSHPTTSVNPKVVQPKDISGFEDFSTSHPEQLPFSIPDESPTPTSNNISSDAQKVNSVNLDIEEVKEFLMDYVDKKFENLESLIKKNHSQLMESRHREDNLPLKDVVGKHMACTVEVFEQKGNVDPQSRTFQFDKQPFLPIQIDLADEVGVSVDEVGVSVNEITISHPTQAAIDALISDLGKVHIPAKPLSVFDQQDLIGNHALLSDSQLPTDIPITEIIVWSVSKIHVPRNRLPSKILQSPYLTSFGSSEKGKDKLDGDIRLYFPFEGCRIIYQPPSNLLDEYMQWVTKGLLKTHANKKSTEDKYRAKASSFGFEMMDFVVAFPIDKNGFYDMSQPNKCWTD
ncbi:hypothetical protein MTR67_001402 [Solanum verrucosum]|uniref:Uncharacterized protein n=1 Tax=Solanum verrucosum TaxID=315347 RepID=A0AAF0T517_SOLVR|nr:hypothetical protein MTR67_001402 [Solanum verrucosum]